MSFASETKKELTNLEVKECCARAELSALIRMNGSLSFSNRHLVVDVQTENAAIARRIYTLLKKMYDLQVELLVRKKMKRIYCPFRRESKGSINGLKYH